MWIDSAGVVHTVALPFPEHHLSGGLHQAILRTPLQQLDLLRARLEELEDLIYEQVASGSTQSGAVDEALPENFILGARLGATASIDQIVGAIQEADPAWRLDAIMLLVDVINNTETSEA